MSQNTKDFVREQGNLEASCYNYATLGHSYCECGLMLPGASEKVKKQVPKEGINCFNILATSAFAVKT